MFSKILLGITLGFLAGAVSVASRVAHGNPALAPVGDGPRTWLQLSGACTPLIALAFVVWTFTKYSAGYGFLAAIEVVGGFTAASVLAGEARHVVAMISIPVAVVLLAVL